MKTKDPVPSVDRLRAGLSLDLISPLSFVRDLRLTLVVYCLSLAGVNPPKLSSVSLSSLQFAILFGQSLLDK
jgi:hypothetical protein